MFTTDNPFLRQARLLLRVLPTVADETCFALKGGTAINLFVHDLPRLSVDIDLVYLPLHGRKVALAEIHDGLRRIRERLAARDAEFRFTEGILHGEGTEIKLIIQAERTTIKIEVSPVLRGTAFAPAVLSASGATQELLGYAECPVVSKADLYGGEALRGIGSPTPTRFI